MRRSKLALAPAFVAFAVLACAGALWRPLACTVFDRPLPLRALYKQSARIVVARIGASEVVQTEEGTALVRRALHVTENVKGGGGPLAHLYEWVDTGPDAPREDQVRIDSGSGRPIARLKEGERYLLFLVPREEGDGYWIDPIYSAKKLSDEDLKVYLERLRELAELTRREPEDKAALVEWLVRCAEEPATRWEGAFEFEQSARAPALMKRMNKWPPPPAPVPPGGEAPAGDVSGEEPSLGSRRVAFAYDFTDPALFPLLSAAQKQRLADALFGAPELGEGESALLQVVKEFEDPRFVPFLLGRLHRVEEDPPEAAAGWLAALASALKNKHLIELTKVYEREATFYDRGEEEEEEEVADGGEEEESPAEVAAAIERASRKRAAQFRAVLAQFDHFVAVGPAPLN